MQNGLAQHLVEIIFRGSWIAVSHVHSYTPDYLFLDWISVMPEQVHVNKLQRCYTAEAKRRLRDGGSPGSGSITPALVLKSHLEPSYLYMCIQPRTQAGYDATIKYRELNFRGPRLICEHYARRTFRAIR